MRFVIWILGWDSLEAVRIIHSVLELSAIIFFILLVVFEVLAHNEEEKIREKLLEKIGLWFFGVAVFMELVAFVYGQRNDTLSGAVITSLDTKAQDAASNASRAVTESGTALSQAAEAKTKSGIALDKANEANSVSGVAKGKAEDALAATREALESQLLLAAHGWPMLPLTFNSLSEVPKANVKFTCTRAGCDFARILAANLKSFGWTISPAKIESGPDVLEPGGIVISNKWLETTEPVVVYPGEEVTLLTLSKVHPEIPLPLLERLVKLSAGLHAPLRREPDLDENSLEIFVGVVWRP